MSWPLFAVIQLVMLTIGVSMAFLLRNRALKQQYLELKSGLEAADAAIEQAKLRVSEGAEKLWLRDRLAELPVDTDIGALQRLVLSNELEPDAKFEADLTKILSSADAARVELARQWEKARKSAADLAASLIEKYPLSHPIISQLHEAYIQLDQGFDVDTPDLPAAPEVTDADATDITQEAEHLRATNELLQQEVEQLRQDLEAASGEDTNEQAEDLKGLLQQFTKDSRDMMACISKLEAENANLRQQLGLNVQVDAAEAAPAAAASPA
jgi:hypothetical protein